MKPRMLALISFLFLSAAQATGDVSLGKGFDHFYNLEYDEAIAEFQRDIRENQDSAPSHNHLAQAILYRAMFRAGALESELVSGTNPFLRRPKVEPTPADNRLFDDAIRRSMEVSQKRLQSNARDTAAMYALGVAYGLRANYNFLVRKAWFDALRDATSGRKLHNKVSELDASNADARLLQGVHDYVVGSLPWHIKLLGFLVGFRGDKDGGIRTLELVGAKGRLNRYDAQILLCAIYRRERLPGKAIPLLDSLIERFPRNYLLRFELAQMHSDNGDKARALAAIQRIEEMRSAGVAGFTRLPAEKIWYARGTIQFWYGDLDAALDNMRRVTARAQDLDLNTGTFAWLRLGQICDLKGRRSEAVQAYRHAVRLAPESDAAKQCRRFLSAPYRRDRQKG